jgi:hypothetical protein
MWKAGIALLCAGLAVGAFALAKPAAAADPARAGVVLYDAAGRPVALLSPLAGVPTDDPALQAIRSIENSMAWPMPFAFPPAGFFAQEQAMFQRLMNEMQQLTSMPIMPDRTIEAMLRPAPGTQGEVSRIVVTSVSNGRGSCSETVRYSYPGSGTQPQVTVRRVGDACGALTGSARPGMPVA